MSSLLLLRLFLVAMQTCASTQSSRSRTLREPVHSATLPECTDVPYMRYTGGLPCKADGLEQPCV